MNQEKTAIEIQTREFHTVRVPPITENSGARPLWSVMIPTYNCAQYLEETLHSVLAQDPGPDAMQIEVVDDCSTRDDPEEVVRKVGRGRVAFYRQAKNVGHVRNFETCLRRSRGMLIHQLHGDDYILPGFYSKLAAAFIQHPEIGAAFCRSIFMGPSGVVNGTTELLLEDGGILEGFAEKEAHSQRIQTPSMVVRRSVYESLGGFDRRLSWTEDWEMWVRIACRYPIWFEPEALAVYRTHGTSSTSNKILSGENVRDIGRCVDIFTEHFAPSVRKCIRANALRHSSKSCIRWYARKAIAEGDIVTGLRQTYEALKISRNLPTSIEAVSLVWFFLLISGARFKRRLVSKWLEKPMHE